MQIMFRLTACDACKTAKAPHASLDGTTYTHQELMAKKPPRLPDSGCCKLVPIGACHFCGINADDLGPAAVYSLDIGRKLTDEKTGKSHIDTLSFCGNCAIYLGGVFFQLAQQGTLDALQRALSPKIVQPGKGLVVPMPHVPGRMKN